MLNLVWFTKAVDQSVREIAPLVLVADISEIDEGANADSHPQSSTLPGQSTQVATRHLESVQMLRGGGRGIFMLRFSISCVLL